MTPSRHPAFISASGGTAESKASLSPATVLRARTTPFHLDTESAYAGFDLTKRRSYLHFLQAHLRAVTAAERALAGTPGLPEWRPRAPFLRDDLDALGAPVPAPLPFPTALDAGRAWGVLYVLEGSRIGSEMLGRGVGQGLPRSYLSQRHGPGEWRAFRAALGTALAGDDLLLQRAVVGAVACFTLFSTAARSSTSWDCWETGLGVKNLGEAAATGGARGFGAPGGLVALQGYPSGFESAAQRDVG